MYANSTLTLRLAVASVVSAIAVGAVCGVALVSLLDLAARNRQAVVQQMQLLEQASAFEEVLFQKGAAANYMLTSDRKWLDDLEEHRRAFRQRLSAARPAAARVRELIEATERAYEEYDRTRNQALARFEQGDVSTAKALLDHAHGPQARLFELAKSFDRLAAERVEAGLRTTERDISRFGWLLVGTSIVGALASLLAGFLLARRVARPIYELQLQLASAAARTPIRISSPGNDLDALGAQVGAIVEQLERTDLALQDERRRVIQSEKLSAMGEMAAKVAHEMLNPLAGMKVAVQRLARRTETRGVEPVDVLETATAVSTEIARVEDLVRRLMDYARPLRPRVEVTPVSALIDAAVAAARPALVAAEATVSQDEGTELPPLEVDPRLIVQVLTNLLVNAAEASPLGACIDVSAHRVQDAARDSVCLGVADRGPGVAPAQLGSLFQPFFTTKAKGHGLGLAVCQNIVQEHQGRIAARPRGDGPGLAVEVWLPVIR